MALFVSAYSRVRVASERGKRDNPAEHPATNARPGIAHGMNARNLTMTRDSQNAASEPRSLKSII